MTTYGEQFRSAMQCETQEDAEVWMKREIKKYMDEFGYDEEKTRKIILTNLGYIAGYYDHDTAQKIDRLFGAEHPIFGSSTYHQDMSPEEAFDLGQKTAKDREST